MLCRVSEGSRHAAAARLDGRGGRPGKQGGERVGGGRFGTGGLLVAVAVDPDFRAGRDLGSGRVRVSGGGAVRRARRGEPRRQELVREECVIGHQAGVFAGAEVEGFVPQGQEAGGLEADDGDAPADEWDEGIQGAAQFCAAVAEEAGGDPGAAAAEGPAGALRGARGDRIVAEVAEHVAGRPSDVRVKIPGECVREEGDRPF